MCPPRRQPDKLRHKLRRSEGEYEMEKKRSKFIITIIVTFIIAVSWLFTIVLFIQNQRLSAALEDLQSGAALPSSSAPSQNNTPSQNPPSQSAPDSQPEAPTYSGNEVALASEAFLEVFYDYDTANPPADPAAPYQGLITQSGWSNMETELSKFYPEETDRR